MKLKKVDFYLDWPVSVEVINLRKFIISNLMKEGRIIRWSIIDIQNEIEPYKTKKLRIHAVLTDS